MLCHVLHDMATVDQLNVPALKSAEVVARRLQVIEEAHRISPSNPDYSSADHFMGWGLRAGGVTVAPGLRKHAASNLKAEAEVAKETRKAKEERRLQGKPKKAKKDDKGKGKGKGDDEG